MVTPTKEQEYITKIHAQEVLIEQLQKEIELHSKQNEFLQQQVNSLTEILIQMRKDKFGSKSEKTKVLDNQLNFFIDLNYGFCLFRISTQLRLVKEVKLVI